MEVIVLGDCIYLFMEGDMELIQSPRYDNTPFFREKDLALLVYDWTDLPGTTRATYVGAETGVDVERIRKLIENCKGEITNWAIYQKLL